MFKLRIVDNFKGLQTSETVRYGIPTREQAETIEGHCNASRSKPLRCEYVAMPMTDREITEWKNARAKERIPQ